MFTTKKDKSALKQIKEQLKTSFGSERIQMVPLSKLQFDTDYKKMFEQEPEKVRRIADNISKDGFDKSQPLIITENFTILDGNSRYLAAKEAGIKLVPVIVKKFASKNESLMYELHLQLDRRNLDDAQKFSAFKRLEELKVSSKSDGKSVKEFTDEKMADQLNVSPRQISKLREIEKKAPPELQQQIVKGTCTINQAHTKMKKTVMKKDTNIHTPVATVPAGSSQRHFDIETFRLGVKFALLESSKEKSAKTILENPRITDRTTPFFFTDKEQQELTELLTCGSPF